MTMPAATNKPAESSPGTYRILTLVGAFLAACLLVTTAALGYASYSQSAKAEQTRADANNLRTQKKDAETETANVRNEINNAKSDKSAHIWCDEFTSAYSSVSLLQEKASELSMKPTAQLDAITEYCPKKKEFVDALASAPRQFVGSTDTCEISDDTVTFSGDVWFDYQPLSDVGDIDLTVSVYMKKNGKPTIRDKALGQTTVTIPSGGTTTYSVTIPNPGLEGADCYTAATGFWPTGI